VHLVQLSDSAASRLPSLARQYLGDAGSTLVSALSPSVRLRRTHACDPAGPASRLGGTALLAGGQPWPVTGDGTPLSFIGQVSTGDISAPDGCPPLPADSLLAFFYEATGQEAWGNDPDWLLLLQADDDVGWMWGDSGTIYYWIRRQDLHRARFDHTWMILQCC